MCLSVIRLPHSTAQALVDARAIRHIYGPTCQCTHKNKTEGLALGTRAALDLFHCTQTDVKVAPWWSTVLWHSILDLWHHKHSLVVNPHIQVVAPNKAPLQGGGSGVCVCMWRHLPRGAPGWGGSEGSVTEGPRPSMRPPLWAPGGPVLWMDTDTALSYCLCLSLFP